MQCIWFNGECCNFECWMHWSACHHGKPAQCTIKQLWLILEFLVIWKWSQLEMDLHSEFKFFSRFVWGSPRLLPFLHSWTKSSQSLCCAFCLDQPYPLVHTYNQEKPLGLRHSRVPWKGHAHHRRPGDSISHFTHSLWWPAQLLTGWGLARISRLFRHVNMISHKIVQNV